MSTPFVIVPNNARSALAANYSAGAGSLTLNPGDGPKFGTPSPSAPVLVTITSQITNLFTIFLCTTRVNDVLSGLTAVNGTSDRNYIVGDEVAVKIVGKHFDDLATAVKALEDAGGAALPLQTGQSGKFLTTNGTAVSWGTPANTIPSQTSHNGKVLGTNGSALSWVAIPAELPAQTGHTGEFLTTDGTNVSWAAASGGGTTLPSQSGEAGKVLTTNGTTLSWAAIPAELPALSGHGGHYLTTDGTTVSWAAVSGGGSLPAQSGNSGKFLTTDGTNPSWTPVTAATLLPSQTGNSGKFLSTDGTNLSWGTIATSGAVAKAPGNDTDNVVQASTDAITLTLEAASGGQTKPLLVFANASGTTQAQFSKDGYLGYGIAPTLPIQARGTFDTDLVKFDSPTGLGSYNGFTIRPCDSARRASIVSIDAMALTWAGADLVLGNNFAETQYRQQRLANLSSGNAFGHRFQATAASDLAGTATLTAFSFELTDNSTTSGVKKFVDFKVGGASKSGLDLSGRFVMAVSTSDPADTPTDASAVFNTTNNKLWIYNPVSAAWKSVTLA